ncbi:MAG: phosphoenolpyruvate--protein phosphotransferase [Planctomycetia bacterium]|nr:phosphoenolpyruvate--protein phosphotransferase [Planctomycetia bacterium]
MKVYRGIAVSSGVAIGRILKKTTNAFQIVRQSSLTPEAELERLSRAFDYARSGLTRRREAATEQLGSDFGKIFEAHLLILEDVKVRQMIETSIKTEGTTAEYAVDSVFGRFAQLLSQLEEEVYAERANDILDVKDRVLKGLCAKAQEDKTQASEPSILVASFLKPSETANLNVSKTLALATESGGMGSHTAIVAAALRIPTVLGIGKFLNEAYDGALAIVDGDQGALILEPDEATLQKYQRLQERQNVVLGQLRAQSREVGAMTADAVAIDLKANIEFPSEAQIALDSGAAGIGLYRTEFLYLADERPELPDEQTHFQAYKTVLETLGKERTTVIRTFDLGADKLPKDLNFTTEPEHNPFMGLRSVRLSLAYMDMFKVQLRALARASVYGKLRIMFPLVTTVNELRKAKYVLRDVCDDLMEEGLPFDENISIGMMVETPATVLMLEKFCNDVDFFSIGTNDLLQYTYAVDRSNRDAHYLYMQESPALIRLIRHVVEVAKYYHKPTCICGQMAGIPWNVPLLLGLGLRELSVAPQMLPKIKAICRAFTITECKNIARQAEQQETADQTRVFLRNELRKKSELRSIISEE